jgi:competence protein ComEC
MSSQLASMSKYHIPFWKSAPFIRITIPFILGIATCYYLNLSEKLCLALLGAFASLITVYTFLRIQLKFRFRVTSGIAINIFIFFGGAYLAASKNPFKNQDITAPQAASAKTAFYVAYVKEPPSEKKSSWKALCEIESIQTGDSNIQTSANLLLYIKKDSNAVLPGYGSRIAFRKTPERIKNFAGNSAFDYQRYCALKNIHYQVFIKPTEITFLDRQNKSPINEFLFKTQDWIVSILRKYIVGSKECGLAEALLIGYKNDLDRTLIQSYSNTGVVHVVAISGLHLGLVYSILNIICKPFKRKLLRPVVILTGLWLFTLLAGGSPSVLRSAVMFSSLVIGETVTRKSSVINNLSVSAFFLLCYDPFWLWDLGFILSYTALLSIVLFMKPLYNLYSSENKIIDTVWKLNAVTISAQVLTLPVLIYCFGQFPNLFLITNFIAIPLSSIILIGEIILCAVYYAQPIASLCGLVLTKLIKLMNAIVEYVDRLPFSSTKHIEVNLLQVVLLYVFIGFMSHWLSAKHKSWQ